MQITGKIIEILPLKSGTSVRGNQWRCQEYILETTGDYPKKICVTVWGDRIDAFSLQMAQQVAIEIELESREYNGRWYTTVRAYKVRPLELYSDNGAPSGFDNEPPFPDDGMYPF
ncbi:DUF3127 domain-containing protein [Thiospirillum jenense]|uniref:DUF3127 domain-containing protein n=2 Tax=Thiospirillum jenense TaxID=1653858 RepID=A0A839HJR9_9GAMM|nr:DUF3127 domain-containing protein [Thiospirillum jenense]